MSATRKIYLSGAEHVAAAQAAQDAIAKGKSHHGVVKAIIDAINAGRKDFDEDGR